ncbi:hypothetical protein Pint_36423 [Pistacia integerrima]|uniref:Uncharacterized protein n=1 Tax=Pistacia integerrima TaxID=434235 RepID=A0ACC0Y3J0_9ROSI|nr:hypothetical protein Pint_36423 [Pistacia integerrima]
MEDHSQVAIKRLPPLLESYDGHCGPDASRFICDNMFLHFMTLDAFVRSPFIVQCIVWCLHMIAKVLGRSNKIVAEQLTRDHSPFVEVRQELKSLHPDDSDIEVLQHGVCVKGILQFYSISLCRSVLTAEPSIYTRVLQPNDKFLIFTSDGLWEQLTNQEVAEIVHNNPRYI